MLCAILGSVALGLIQGTSDLGICVLCYIGNCSGVVRLCSSGFDSWGAMSDLGRCAFCYIYIYIRSVHFI